MAKQFNINIDRSWTLFLDRDGVINERIPGGYITSPDEFKFLPGVLDSFSIFSATFNRIIIVTNQQGIGKGLMTEEELDIIHSFMIEEIKEAGGSIDKIYYCQDLSEKENNCRKPSTKMAQMAVNEFPDIDLNKSIMVGDTKTDIMFGKNAGMKTIFVETAIEAKHNIYADYIITGLSDLGDLIINNKSI